MGYIMMLVTLVGTIANAFGKRWSFAVWLATNLYWTIHNGANGDIPQMLIFAVNAIICIIGLNQWEKERSKKHGENKLETETDKP